MKLLRTFIIVVALAHTVQAAVAQETNDLSSDASQSRARNATVETTLGRVLTFVKGTTPADGVLLMPTGWHPSRSLTSNNLSSVNLVAFLKKSLIGGTFQNSFGDRVWFLGVTRTLISKKRFGIDYSAGLMFGYDGNLAPSVNSVLRPLFEGNVNPYFAIAPYYQISEQLEVRLLAAPPNIVVFGLKYLF